MEANKLHRGRLIDHIQLIVNDINASYKFYSALFKELGIPELLKGEDHFCYDELFVSTKDSAAALGKTTGRHHLAFQAKDKATVDRVHKVGIAAGGKDNGAPGNREYHPGYYACFWLDPDGNNIEVVYHGPAKKSAEFIEITF